MSETGNSREFPFSRHVGGGQEKAGETGGLKRVSVLPRFFLPVNWPRK